MANRKISELIEATSISGTDVLPIVNGGYTQKVKVDTLAEVTNEYTRANFLSLSGGTVTTGLSVNEIFEVGTGLTVLFVSGSRVGINTKTPNEALTVNGEISASNIIYDNEGNSSQWNFAYSNQINFLPLSGGSMTGSLTVVGNISATQNYFSGNNKSVLTPQTNTTGTSAIGNIVAVSALPVSPDPSTLYIIV